MSAIIISFGTQIVVFGFLFLFAKYALPKTGIDSVEKLDKAAAEYEFIFDYASSFTAWAKEFMPKSTGEEKMGAVVNKLSVLTEKFNIDMDRSILMAITQNAYNVMKAGLASNESSKALNNMLDIYNQNNINTNLVNMNPEVTE